MSNKNKYKSNQEEYVAPTTEEATPVEETVEAVLSTEEVTAVAEEVITPVVEPIVEEVTAPVVEPIVEETPVVEPIVEKVTAPVVEPIVEPTVVAAVITEEEAPLRKLEFNDKLTCRTDRFVGVVPALHLQNLAVTVDQIQKILATTKASVYAFVRDIPSLHRRFPGYTLRIRQMPATSRK